MQYYDELQCQAKFHASFRNLTQMSKGTENTQKSLAKSLKNGLRLNLLERGELIKKKTMQAKKSNQVEIMNS